MLMLQPSPNLDKNSIRLLDYAPIYENYAKLYFDATHLKRD